jgi:hypothetical protein
MIQYFRRTPAVLFVIALFAVTAPGRADTPELPTYSYAIQSPGFRDAGVFVSAIHLRVPSTLWTCDITYGRAGLLLRCSTPRLDGGELPEIITRVSCASSDTDAETVHLSTLDPGVYASLSILCKRNLYDDGF